MPRVSEARLEERRRTILVAAVACFARDGFHRTTMADIAEMAGVSTGLAYRYFGGKDDILSAAVRESSMSSASPPGNAADIDDPQALLALGINTKYQRFAMPERDARLRVRFRAWGEALDDEDIKAEIVRRWRVAEDVMVALLTRAQEQGLIAADLDPRAVARVMNALDDGLDLQWKLDPDIDLERCREVEAALFRGWFARRNPQRDDGDGDGTRDPKRAKRRRMG